MIKYAVDFNLSVNDSKLSTCAFSFSDIEMAHKFYDLLTDIDGLSDEDIELQIGEAFSYCMSNYDKYFTNIENLYYFKDNKKYFKYENEIYQVINENEIQINGFYIEE